MSIYPFLSCFQICWRIAVIHEAVTILCVSVVSVVISPFSSLTLFASSLFIVSLAKDMFILSFQKKRFLLIFKICFCFCFCFLAGLTPAISSLWEAEEGGSPDQEFETSLANMVKPHLY